MRTTPDTARKRTQNAVQRRPAPARLGWAALLAAAAIAPAGPARAQADADAPRQRAIEIERRFAPPVVHLPGEARVIDADRLGALCDDAGQHALLSRWLAERGVAVLDRRGPGLALHYYAQGIDAMTRIDRLWEGLPREAESLQDLVDHAITQAREQGKPIRHLVIAGHAGLPGCAAFGGTLDDCVFDGKLSDYQRRQLARLRPYLADDAEIELRQCVTGRGREGQRLLAALHDVTGAAASSYLADFHFGDSANHPRVRFDANGLKIIAAGK
ncbi:MAG: DUF4347 domain-containing protein [Phycisphaeraceae bacterium]